MADAAGSRKSALRAAGPAPLALVFVLLLLPAAGPCRAAGGDGPAKRKKGKRRKKRRKGRSSANARDGGDGSVCFNGCSGHGVCREYHCNCADGYHGEDCAWTFVDDGGTTPRRERVGRHDSNDKKYDMTPPPAILSVGSMALTSSNFQQAMDDNPVVLVGFSSHSCTRCIAVEREYEMALPKLNELGVPFARVNTDAERRLIHEHAEFENIFPACNFCLWQ